MVYQTPILRAQAKSVSTYPSYKSPYGPKYHIRPHLAGMSFNQLTGLAYKSAGFGAVALFAVIFYASGIPRVQTDILQKVPFLGGHYVKEIPASDNPF
ncbi:ubiquinol-cytochrome-c reductase complex subunit-domain-containing protein [Xylariaceae sp. FL0594]|nr:ubiquinol-cytochrome-c reductase complex subunit-domain-containing protein [Xylariaceae sp. FL0594]